MAEIWGAENNITLSPNVIEKGLKKIGYTSKKTFGYAEANAKKRQDFLKELEKVNPTDIIYSDETGIDDNEASHRGWSPKGTRCHAEKKAERKSRYNITAALNLNTLFAPFMFEGYSNSSTYETYVEKVLVPKMRPGMVLVIDNASFHKSQRVVDLIEAAGCKVLFLPPYSPDLNPIEHWWSAVKTRIRSVADEMGDFYEAAVITLGIMCKA